MTQSEHRIPANQSPSPELTKTSAMPPIDLQAASARIPDAVAVLSYGTRPVGQLGVGPRIF
jgi:hypothetical protein